MKYREDTIVALATPPGEGGIAVIRISGKEAISLAGQLFSGPVASYKSHTAHWGIVQNKEGEKIDEALLLVMRAPRSYTGEDTVEIQCHGGRIASTKVLERALEVGALMAAPGEFTFRAFMNGKIDLAQAEAVQTLISAKCEKAYNYASKQLDGALSRKIEMMNKELLFLAALFEAWVDFPEEGLEFISFEEAASRLKKVISEMKELLKTFHDGKKLHTGMSVALIGAPNVGKSSLMNALLEEERAIVTPLPGTTRDLITSEFTLDGYYFRLIDTAGIRETTEIIEKEGIRRSYHLLNEADIILLVLDASKGIGNEEKLFLERVPAAKTIAIWNKIDLCQKPPPSLSFPFVAALSAKERWGIEQLKKHIVNLGSGESFGKEEVILSSGRHKEALQRAYEALERSYQGIQEKAFQEVLAFEMRSALNEIGYILGTNVSEDILSSIFSNFCIGK